MMYNTPKHVVGMCQNMLLYKYLCAVSWYICGVKEYNLDGACNTHGIHEKCKSTHNLLGNPSETKSLGCLFVESI